MAAIGTIQRVGNTHAGPQEVELNTLAARSVIRPANLRGVYGYGTAVKYFNGTTLTPNGRLLAARWPGAAGAAVIKKISVSLVLTIAGTGSAGTYSVTLARTHFNEITINADTTAYGGARTTNQVGFPYRSAMPDSILDFNVGADAGGAASAALTLAAVNNRVIETGLDGYFTGSMPLVSGSYISGDLFDARVAEQPLVLLGGDGFEVAIADGPTASAATTIQTNVSMSWEEYDPQGYF